MLAADRLAEPKPRSGAGPVSGMKLAVVMGLFVLALLLRGWNISEGGLNQFDEGVYAFSALGLSDASQPQRLYPDQVKFSPPLFLGLTALAYMALGGPSDTAALLVNVILGALTVPLLWWVGRSWFESQVGIAAAALLAFSTFHITLSRTALTDVAFAFFFLLALAAIVHALERQSLWAAVAAGVAVGLTWNTKYHGFLALAVAGVALAARARGGGTVGTTWSASVRTLAIATIVAVVCFLPWAIFIQSQGGGSAALGQYYLQFLSVSSGTPARQGGIPSDAAALFQHLLLVPREWLQSVSRQVENQYLLDGSTSRASTLVALLCVTLLSHRAGRLTAGYLALVAALAVSSLVFGGFGTVAIAMVAGTLIMFRERPSLVTWVVLSWFLLWLLLTPLYRPYARLLLPLYIPMFLVAGAGIAALAGAVSRAAGRPDWRPLVSGVAAMLVAIVAGGFFDQTSPWRSARSVADAALALETVIPPGSPVVVIGEPALAFYLHLANRPAFERTEDPAVLAQRPAPAYVVTGLYAKAAPAIRDGLSEMRDQLEPIGTFSLNPTEVRLLDDLRPAEASRFRAHPDSTYDLTLYRFSPKVTAR